jgi:hypothetical protein
MDHFITSSCSPASQESAQAECYGKKETSTNQKGMSGNESKHVQYIDHIQLKTNGLFDGITGDETLFSHTCVM